MQKEIKVGGAEPGLESTHEWQVETRKGSNNGLTVPKKSLRNLQWTKKGRGTQLQAAKRTCGPQKFFTMKACLRPAQGESATQFLRDFQIGEKTNHNQPTPAKEGVEVVRRPT